MGKPKVSIAVNSEILNKIDSIKEEYGIETPSYRELIRKICDILLEKKETKKQESKELKYVINKILTFLHEKTHEDDYLEEDFFKTLFKMYAKIIERLRK